ncbi:MAG: hypothetical protein MMC33_005023 [Icmadophila ericetorum]|nr:hypothetical protein [Icmadophila ericetorum]
MPREEATGDKVVTDLSVKEFAWITSTPQVKIKVGYAIYQVPIDLICNIVPYFQKAFYGGFKEGVIKEIDLSDTVPGCPAFELFLTWLYQGRPGLDSSSENFEVYLNLYLMADMWSLKKLMNSIIDILSARLEGVTPPFETLNRVVNAVDTCWPAIEHLDKLKSFVLSFTMCAVSKCKKAEAPWQGPLMRACKNNPDFAVRIAVGCSQLLPDDMALPGRPSFMKLYFV